MPSAEGHTRPDKVLGNVTERTGVGQEGDLGVQPT